MKWVVLGNRAIFTVRILIMTIFVAGGIFEKRAFGAIEAHRGIGHGGYFPGGTGFARRLMVGAGPSRPTTLQWWRGRDDTQNSAITLFAPKPRY